MQGSRQPGTAGAFFSDADDLEPSAATMEDWKRAAQVPIAGCGIFAMDEIHQYKVKACKGGMTHPFQLLYKFIYQENPTLAMGVSGNTMSIGPDGWHHLVGHTQQSIQRHPRLAQAAKLCRLQTPQEYARVKRDWDFVLNKINNGGEELEECQGRIRPDFQQGIEK